MEKWDGTRAVSPALKTGFKVPGKHVPATQTTRKDLAKPPLRGSHASAGQCCGAGRSTGTPETISDSIKRRPGSRDDWESSVVFARKSTKCSLALFSQRRLSYQSVCRRGEKRRHKAQIMIQRNKKEGNSRSRRVMKRYLWYEDDRMCAQHNTHV